MRTEPDALIGLVPTAREAVATWGRGEQHQGTFEITDQDLMVLSQDARREMQSALVEASATAEYVLEWERDHDRSTVMYSWRRQLATITSLDCRDGKHLACIGEAWDDATDAPAGCACNCHTPRKEGTE